MMNIEKCVICLEEFKENDKLFLKCAHYYHTNCIFKYIMHNSKIIKQQNFIQCPLCRSETENNFILRILDIEFDNLQNNLNILRYKKCIFENKILFLNFRKLLWFKKNKNLPSKEEELMNNIEKINYKIIEENENVKFIRKVYNKLI
jgi:hypothetical protein